jgi:hypothetical protein
MPTVALAAAPGASVPKAHAAGPAFPPKTFLTQFAGVAFSDIPAEAGTDR